VESIDNFVGQELHAADPDGDGLLLLPQRNLRANISKRVVATRPDFTVRDMLDQLVAAVAHVSKVRLDGDLGWAQTGGETLIAALRSAIKRAMGEGAVQMTGIRVVGARFTCLKGMLDAAALHCLSLAAPEPSDGFPVHCWGGDVVDRSKQTRKVCWALTSACILSASNCCSCSRRSETIRARQRSGV